MDKEIAQELMKQIDDLVTRKIQSVITPYVYGQVTHVTAGNDSTCTLITVEIDGTTQTVEGVKCLEHVVPHEDDYVLLMPVNGLTGDWVCLAVVKSAYVPGQLINHEVGWLETGLWSQAVTAWQWYAPGISVSFTPAVDCYALLLLDCWMMCDDADVDLRSRIQRTAPSQAAEGYGAANQETASRYWNVPVHRLLDYKLSGGTTYTFQAWVQWGGTTTGTIYHDADCTKLSLLAWKAYD